MGNGNVLANQTISTTVFDWDGVDGYPIHTTTIFPGVTFTINSDVITDFSPNTDGFDDIVTVNSGTLTVNTVEPWRMGGFMNLNNTSGGIPTVNGQEMMVGGPTLDPGTINVTGGEADINADVTFESTAVVTVDETSTLRLNGTTRFEGGSYTGAGEIRFNSDVFVDAATTLDIDTTWNSGSTLNTTAGIDFTLNGDVEINAGATLNAENVVTAGQDPSHLISYNGATVGGAGTFRQFGNGTVSTNQSIGTTIFDWDGLGSSVTTIDSGVTFTINSDQIDVTDPGTDGFDGIVNVDSSALTVNTLAPWRMEGTMNLNNTGAGIPTVNGQEMVVGNSSGGSATINVTGGVAVINADVTFESTAVVTADAASTLRLNGAATFQGGSYTGAGVIHLEADAVVEEATTIDVDRLNLDGLVAGDHTITLNDSLTLNVDTLDVNNGIFQDTIAINGATSTLTVNTPDPWEMAGTLQINSGTSLPAVSIAGQDFEMSGDMNVTNGTRIDARIDVTGSGTVDLQTANSFLSLSGGDLADMNRIEGGAINGPAGAQLRAVADNGLAGYGSITSDINFASGSALLADDGTLNLHFGALVGLGQIGTADADGILDVQNAWSTNLADELRLGGGQVTGGAITNDGTTVGHGTIWASGFDNNGTTTAQGGTLVFDNSIASLDLDGTTNTGTLNAREGTIEVQKDVGVVPFGGELNIAAGGEFRMTKFFNGLTVTGQMNMTGGTYRAALLGIEGVLDIGVRAATVDATSTSFESGGMLAVDIASAPPGSYGQLSITGTVDLDGTLDVELIGGFDPAAGDAFKIMTFGSRTGEFSEHDGLGLLTDVYLLPLYGEAQLVLYAAVPGDVNLDGTVDGLDVNVASANFATAAGFQSGDANGDGVVDEADIDVISSYFGQTVAAPPPLAGSLQAVPEPTSALLLALGLTALMVSQRRGCEFRDAGYVMRVSRCGMRDALRVACKAKGRRPTFLGSLASDAIGIELRAANNAKLAVRVAGDETSCGRLPEG